MFEALAFMYCFKYIRKRKEDYPRGENADREEKKQAQDKDLRYFQIQASSRGERTAQRGWHFRC